jgi:hypothetical protein
MCSPHGLGRVSNPQVTKAKTVDSLRNTWVIFIMNLVVSTVTLGEEMGGRDMTTLSAYSPMQDEGLAYTAAFDRTLTRQDDGVT